MSEFLGVALTFRALRTRGRDTCRQLGRLEREARERVEDGRLRLRGGAAPDIVVFGGGRLTLKTRAI